MMIGITTREYRPKSARLQASVGLKSLWQVLLRMIIGVLMMNLLKSGKYHAGKTFRVLKILEYMCIFAKSISKFVVATHPISHCFETSLQFHAHFSFRHAFLISFLFVFVENTTIFRTFKFPINRERVYFQKLIENVWSRMHARTMNVRKLWILKEEIFNGFKKRICCEETFHENAHIFVILKECVQKTLKNRRCKRKKLKNCRGGHLFFFFFFFFLKKVCLIENI